MRETLEIAQLSKNQVIGPKFRWWCVILMLQHLEAYLRPSIDSFVEESCTHVHFFINTSSSRKPYIKKKLAMNNQLKHYKKIDKISLNTTNYDAGISSATNFNQYLKHHKILAWMQRVS